MTTYAVTLTQTANHTAIVEADSVESAIEKAEQDTHAGLCHQCACEIDLDPGHWEVPEGSRMRPRTVYVTEVDQ